MNTGKDLLKQWIEKVGLLKFKLHRPYDPVYITAIETEKTLRAFFSKNDYTISKNGSSEDNYLVYLLTGNSLRDIHLLNEMAGLIRYAGKSDQKFQLKKNDNTVPHNGLSNALFEVLVNVLLKNRGFKLESNSEYTDSKGNIRPLDAYFKFNGKEYLVECYRVDEPVSRSMTMLSQYLMRFAKNKQISASQAFVGHIGFKTDKNLSHWIDQAKGKISELFKNYLKAFDTEKLTLAIPHKYSEEAYSIEILPYYMATKHAQEMKSTEHDYTSLVTFETRPKMHSINNCEFVVSGARVVSNEASNEKLFKRVKAKLTQHKDAPFNKIYFIEIDTTFGINPNNPIFPIIRKGQVDFNKFGALLDEQTTIVLAFKEATNDGIKHEFGFMNIGNYNDDIIKAFTKQELTLSTLGLVSIANFK